MTRRLSRQAERWIDQIPGYGALHFDVAIDSSGKKLIGKPLARHCQEFEFVRAEVFEQQFEAFKASLIGQWSGWYQCGSTFADLVVTVDEDMTGEFAYKRYSRPIREGSYAIGVKVPTSKKAQVFGTKWIDRSSSSIRFLDFDISADSSGETLNATTKSHGCKPFQLTKTKNYQLEKSALLNEVSGKWKENTNAAER